MCNAADIVIPSGRERLEESFSEVEGPCVHPGSGNMRDEYIYYVYMMQSTSRRALYIGMTNNLHKRVWEHKNHIREGFTD
ncbi:MAG: GIY-YIG nuclease family protein, partial [Candidatus Sulfotelmatobacter sp.]